MAHRRNTSGGFTLIELSIVLVVIGLLVGGLLVGRDLIGTATVRAQISQIEKYNQAVNTFKGKYDYLPGDIPAVPAAQFGFAARGSKPGQGDGDGILKGNYNDNSSSWGCELQSGEGAMLWVDLSQAKLIDQTFNTAVSVYASVGTNITNSQLIAQYMPKANIGGGNFVYAWSGGPGTPANDVHNGNNYFGLSIITALDPTTWCASSNPGLTVAQAKAIDSKIDDGQPQFGNVQAFVVSLGCSWTIGGMYPNGPHGAGINSGTPNYGMSTAAQSAQSYTCYDNGNTAGVATQYTTGSVTNNGTQMNCGLSFKFQ